MLYVILFTLTADVYFGETDAGATRALLETLNLRAPAQYFILQRGVMDILCPIF